MRIIAVLFFNIIAFLFILIWINIRFDYVDTKLQEIITTEYEIAVDTIKIIIKLDSINGN